MRTTQTTCDRCGTLTNLTRSAKHRDLVWPGKPFFTGDLSALDICQTCLDALQAFWAKKD